MSAILERNSLNLKNFGIMYYQFVRGTTEVQQRSYTNLRIHDTKIVAAYHTLQEEYVHWN